MRKFLPYIFTAAASVAGFTSFAAASGGSPDAVPCSPTGGYPCEAATTVPATLPEGACQLAGLDYALAEPTYLNPSTDRVIDVTAFVEVNPTSGSRMLCTLHFNSESAERLYLLLDSMMTDGIVVGEVPTPTAP